MKVPAKYGGGSMDFWMFDVGGQRGERRKWLSVMAHFVSKTSAFWFVSPMIHYSVIKHYLTNIMELSPSVEASSCTATQELPNILWNMEVHYCVCKSPPAVPILNQINPISTTQFYLSMNYLILFTHLHLGVPSGCCPSGFSTNILYTFLGSRICATCPVHSILFDFVIIIMLYE
jgi:hypothetical protein